MRKVTLHTKFHLSGRIELQSRAWRRRNQTSSHQPPLTGQEVEGRTGIRLQTQSNLSHINSVVSPIQDQILNILLPCPAPPRQCLYASAEPAQTGGSAEAWSPSPAPGSLDEQKKNVIFLSFMVISCGCVLLQGHVSSRCSLYQYGIRLRVSNSLCEAGMKLKFC